LEYARISYYFSLYNHIIYIYGISLGRSRFPYIGGEGFDSRFEWVRWLRFGMWYNRTNERGLEAKLPITNPNRKPLCGVGACQWTRTRPTDIEVASKQPSSSKISPRLPPRMMP
jgi:hypothetical protein